MNKSLEQVIFWLKPSGKHFCNGNLKREIGNFKYCIKVNYYPVTTLDCKYLDFNAHYPQQSQCNYNKK